MFSAQTILTFFALITSSHAQTCPYTACTCQGNVIDCSQRGLTAVPNRLNTGSSFTTLLLNGNLISNLTTATSLPISLDTLDLRDNPIVNIDTDALRDVSQSLKVIKFRNSNFTVLPAALESLNNLEVLDIEGMPLTFPTPTVSILGSSVTELRLVNMNLRNWPSFLQSFIFLRKLFLDDNSRLGNAPVGTFDLWANELTHLSLANTGMSQTSALSVLVKLQWLDLSNNKIADTVALSYDLITLGDTLTYLDLSHNLLTTEPRLIELRVLKEINLSDNKIDTSNTGAFYSSVTTINVDNNDFASIPEFFHELTMVSNFSIKNNHITSIAQTDFPVGSRLVSLYLGGNPITVVDDHGFDNIRNYLTYIDLANTQLDRLPLALQTLTKLDTLWMPGNTNLVCTCEEKALATWLSNRPPTTTVVGQCGNVDIKEFLTQLATLCP